jgi:nucleotide-binding universal stress UspA family protein
MERTHLVVVNDGQNMESAFEYACETFPEDLLVALYVDSASEEVRSVRLDESAATIDDWIGAHREEAARAFDEARALAAVNDVDVETAVAFGALTDAVQEYCRTHDVDTVIVGCTDRDAFSSYIVGDDVTRVANTAPVPVVVV